MGRIGGGASAIGPAETLSLVEHEPGVFAMYTWKNVIAVIWRGEATEGCVRRISHATVRLTAGWPSGFSCVHVTHEGGGLPSSGARSVFIEMMGRHGGNVAGVGVVLKGNGFWASAVQGAVTGMRMLSPKSFPLRVEHTVRPVAQWLAPMHTERTGTTVHPSELNDIIELATSRFTGGEVPPAAPSAPRATG
jgi:hypothetical protein